MKLWILGVEERLAAPFWLLTVEEKTYLQEREREKGFQLILILI